MLRMDMQQVPTGFLMEYSLGDFDPYRYDGVNGDDDMLTETGQLLGLYDMPGYSKVNNNASIALTDSLSCMVRLTWPGTTAATLPYRSPSFTCNTTASGKWPWVKDCSPAPVSMLYLFI